MKRKTALLSACLLGSAAAHAAPVVSTSAATFATAQVIAASSFTLNALANVFDSTTVAHAEIVQAARPRAGIDYYRFSHAGGNVTIDIDGTSPNFNSFVGLYSLRGYLLAHNNDGVWDFDQGSASNPMDSLIRDFDLYAGDYVVAVCQLLCASFQGGEQVVSQPFLIPRGTQYTLNISASPVVNAPTDVPEPASLALAGLGLFAALAVHKRR